MAIQMRRGAITNLDRTKLLPGEWAICTDGTIVICYASGKTVDIITKSNMEKHVLKIENSGNDTYTVYYSDNSTEKLTIKSGADVDTTLTLSGKAADAKVVGDKFSQLSNEQKVYVTLEEFGGSGDGVTINDDAFAQAMQSGYNLVLQRGKTYLFSGDYIDLGDYGNRKIIYGNDATVKKLSFKWNINSSNERVVDSAISEFPLSFENITFADNTKPIVLTASNVDVKRCNFSGCTYCFAFPEYYIDYFHMSDSYFYQTSNVISTFDYDGTEKEYGVYGDWFVFERCHFPFSDGGKVFTNSPNHGGAIYLINCLHGIFTINNSRYYRYKFIFKGHHFEQGGIVNNTPTIPIPAGFVKISDTFMYSSLFPNVSDGMEFDNIEINYGNMGNYKVVDCEHGKYVKKFAEQIIEFDEFEFKYGERPPKLVTPGGSQYYYTSGTTNSGSYQKYDSVHTFKYAIATSLEKDRLYFNGETKDVYFSEEFSNTANRTCSCSVYFDCYTYLKNIYLHIFKYMDGVLYRCVIPITRYLRSDATVDSNGLFTFHDEPQGVFGCPWAEYDGVVAYEQDVEVSNETA